MLSARYGRVHFAQAMVEAGLGLDLQDVNGNTAVLLAAQYGHTNMVNYLVKTKCNPSVKNKISREALHMACERGHPDCVKILLGVVEDINAVDGTKEPPIVLAARHGHHDVARVLIDAKCDIENPSQMDQNQRRAIHFASVSGYDEFLDVLLQAGADPDVPDRAGNSPLLLGATWGHSAVVRSLLKCKVDVNRKNTLGLCAVIMTSAEGHREILRQLLDAGADPDAVNHMRDPAILVACQNSNTDCAEVLIENGCDMDLYDEKHGRTALTWAIDNGLKELAKKMIEKGADVDAGRTGSPLEAACKKEDEGTVDLLLGKGADVNKRLLPEETTAVMFALETGNVEICRKLLNAGADPNLPTIYRVTCLMLGTDRSGAEVTRLLLEKGADVNYKGFQGYSVMFADEVDVVRELLAGGGNINQQDDAGNTPLIRAATYTLKGLVKFLIKNNANVNIKGMSYTACEQALIEDQGYDIAKMLIKAGCDLSFLQRWERTCYPKTLEDRLERIEWLKEQAKLPPSLTHCCRKSILNALATNIPKKIDELNLPKNLKDYLHYVDLDEDENGKADGEGSDDDSDNDDSGDDGDNNGDDDGDAGEDASSDEAGEEANLEEMMGYLQLMQQLQRLQQE
ncbi:ankyrin repeat domain-containing protein 17-like isoform X2 [Lineus longissimus]